MEFLPVDNASALLQSRGVYSIHDIYQYKGLLYAKKGNGFLKLMKARTSVGNVQLVEIKLPFEPTKTAAGAWYGLPKDE